MFYELGTGSIAVLPMGSTGRFSSFPQISGHQGICEAVQSFCTFSFSLQGFVTDFDFSPFNDNMISTGSEDCTVSVVLVVITWDLPFVHV